MRQGQRQGLARLDDRWRDAAQGGGDCDASVLQRNTELGRKHRVNGTPALVFEDGKRVPGVMPLDALERQLAASRQKG